MALCMQFVAESFAHKLSTTSRTIKGVMAEEGRAAGRSELPSATLPVTENKVTKESKIGIVEWQPSYVSYCLQLQCQAFSKKTNGSWLSF